MRLRPCSLLLLGTAAYAFQLGVSSSASTRAAPSRLRQPAVQCQQQLDFDAMRLGELRRMLKARGLVDMHVHVATGCMQHRVHVVIGCTQPKGAAAVPHVSEASCPAVRAVRLRRECVAYSARTPHVPQERGVSIEGCFDRDSLVERASQFRCQLEAIPVPPPPAWPGGAPLEQGPQSGAPGYVKKQARYSRPVRPERLIGRGWPEFGAA